MSLRFLIQIALAALVTLTAHAAQPPPVLHRVRSSELPLLGIEGDLKTFKAALQNQMTRCLGQNLDEKFRFGHRIVTRRKWCIETNRQFLQLAENARTFQDLILAALNRFEWYESVGRDGQGDVLFTGYDCPSLRVSATPTRELQVPIYRKPDELISVIEHGREVWGMRNSSGSLVPYYDRKSIDVDRVLKGRGLELGYAADPFDVFILQIQGSGVLLVQSPDGVIERRFLDYAGQNGQPYTSIGQVLHEEGVPEKYLSVPGMRVYFHEHPAELMPTLLKNSSYIFFRFADDGPYGAGGVILTPRQSIAVDLSVFPLGAVTFFKTQRPIIQGSDPVNGTVTWQDFSTLALTQDTGGAIIGPGHVDIYWGEDDYAQQAAGLLENSGKLFFAVAR
jgi:membrane-bound lytic murein transglycosylase A